ncbi:MAG: putative lipid II flippase FtsW [Actinobacteria bacterium]|nr:putative lipid II flippase FtsW [Actinomycetota bacterium]
MLDTSKARKTSFPKPEKRESNHIKKTSFPAEVYLLLSLITILTALGIVMTFSASFPLAVQTYSSPTRLFLKQLISLSIALIGSFMAYKFSKSVSLRKFWFLIWLSSLGFTLLTFVPGLSEEAKGAARWIDFGIIRFQPSEILKVAVIIATAHLAYVFVRTKEKIYLYLAFMVVTISSLIVLLQKDMTTAAIIFFAGSISLILTPVNLRELIPLWLIAIVGSFFGVIKEEYRFRRLLVFIDPWKDLDAGRQVVISLLALAKGGIQGVGIGKSIFKYNVLPEAHTDFIFAIIGSELGLFGSLTVIILLFLVFLCGLRISNKMRDDYSRAISTALISMLAFQAIINIGGTVKALPPTGVPLPFVSFGGSSMVVSYAIIGIICGLSARGFRNDKDIRSRRGN